MLYHEVVFYGISYIQLQYAHDLDINRDNQHKKRGIINIIFL